MRQDGLRRGCARENEETKRNRGEIGSGGKMKDIWGGRNAGGDTWIKSGTKYTEDDRDGKMEHRGMEQNLEEA